MNTSDLKDGGGLTKSVAELIKSVGPTDEQRQAFGRTFFGTLLGQTVILIGTMLLYIGALAAIWQYWSTGLKAFHSDVGEWFWPIFGAPFFCILLFSMLPTALLALRRRRLRAAAISDHAYLDGTNFRPYPYQETDRAAFKRLDGADRTILNWLTSTRASLLYLSGASGVGKSSLVAAYVIPELRELGWSVVETRLFDDPIARLRAAILDIEPSLSKRAYADLSLLDLLKKAADVRAHKNAAPLLLVADQFEELLIFHNMNQGGTFATFLGGLVKTPIDGIRLLLIFRSDYRPLVFKLELPSLVAGSNWHELAPYDREGAIVFLRNGGRALSSEASDMLFRGLDRIEDTPGLYRLITLNMVGLVLDRMGRTLEGDAGRLIQSYLTTCLTTGESRDFAKPLLSHMISDVGTKEPPQSEAALVEHTGFAPWQVQATLADLARYGLVRRLEATTAIWEVAHAFLARIVGQLIGRLKPSIWQRSRPLIAPVVLMGWIALAVSGLPWWSALQERAAQAALRQLGATFSEGTRSGGILIKLSPASDDDMLKASRYLEKIDFSDLDLSVSGITDLKPVARLTNLSSLNLDSTNITNLEPLRGLTNLRFLDLDSTNIEDLTPLRALKKLNSLKLYKTNIKDLRALTALANLSTLNLDGTEIKDLEPLRELKNLKSLDFDNTRIKELAPLKGLTDLNTLSISGDTGITNLEPLKGLTKLSTLIFDNTKIGSLEPLKELKNLGLLSLNGNKGIINFGPLEGLTNLTQLNLSGTTITTLEPLKKLINLTSLNLDDTDVEDLGPLKGLTNLSTLSLDQTSINDLEPLKDLPNLKQLSIYGTGVSSLKPLKGRRVDVSGATDRLLSTMQ